MKKISLLVLCLFASTSYAQSIVYKCTDSSGNISYTNNKGMGCSRTDLADPEKSSAMVIRNDRAFKKLDTSGFAGLGNTNVAVNNDEQRFRDSKRQLILSHELDDEKQQLDTVNSMLKNANGSQDSQQVAQLTEMQQTHMKNIADLQKQLGVANTVAPVVVATSRPKVNIDVAGNSRNTASNAIIENEKTTRATDNPVKMVEKTAKNEETVAKSSKKTVIANNDKINVVQKIQVVDKLVKSPETHIDAAMTPEKFLLSK
jgi:hypothetical protein